MEQALGTVLLERGRRGIGLTPAGRSVAHHARAVLAQVERMRGDLAEHAQGLRGRVRLLSNTAALTELLPDALAPWLAANPGVDTRGPAPRLSGRCGRVLRTPESLRTGYHSGLETFPFREDRLVLVVARGHALASRRPIAFRDVIDTEFVGLAGNSALQQHLGWQAAQAGRPLRLRVRVQGLDTVCRLVGRGVGVGIVPETAARRCRRATGHRGGAPDRSLGAPSPHPLRAAARGPADPRETARGAPRRKSAARVNLLRPSARRRVAPGMPNGGRRRGFEA